MDVSYISGFSLDRYYADSNYLTDGKLQEFTEKYIRKKYGDNASFEDFSPFHYPLKEFKDCKFDESTNLAELKKSLEKAVEKIDICIEAMEEIRRNLEEFYTGQSTDIDGIVNAMYNIYALEYLGFWQASSKTAEKVDLKQRLKVGGSDIQGKTYNGYWSLKNGSAVFEDKSSVTFYVQYEDFGIAMGMFHPVYFNENFNDGNYDGWTATGTWTCPQVQTWSGHTTQNTRVVQASVTGNASMLLSNYSGNDNNFLFIL